MVFSRYVVRFSGPDGHHRLWDQSLLLKEATSPSHANDHGVNVETGFSLFENGVHLTGSSRVCELFEMACIFHLTVD